MCRKAPCEKKNWTDMKKRITQNCESLNICNDIMAGYDQGGESYPKDEKMAKLTVKIHPNILKFHRSVTSTPPACMPLARKCGRGFL